MAVFGIFVNRELKKYSGLKFYFLSEGLHDKRFRRLVESYKDPMTKLHILFFQSRIITFTNFNEFLQREESLVCSICDHMQTFMKKLSNKFIQSNVFQELKNAKKSFIMLDISLERQNDDNDLFIGFITKQTSKKLLQDKKSPRKADRFFDGIRAFYKAEYEYCTKRLPLDNNLLKNCRFVDFCRRSEFSFDDVKSIVSAFPQLSQDIFLE